MAKLASALILCILHLLAVMECKAEDLPKEKTVIFKKVDYEFNEKLMTMSVKLKNNTNGIPTVDLDSELFIDIPDDIYVNTIVSKKGSQVEYLALIKTGKLNVCNYFKKHDREPLIKILIGNLEKFGKMMFNCPVKKGKYYLRDFYLESSSLPSFTPPGEYRLDFSVTKKEKDAFVQVFRMIWFASISN